MEFGDEYPHRVVERHGERAGVDAELRRQVRPNTRRLGEPRAPQKPRERERLQQRHEEDRRHAAAHATPSACGRQCQAIPMVPEPHHEERPDGEAEDIDHDLDDHGPRRPGVDAVLEVEKHVH